MMLRRILWTAAIFAIPPTLAASGPDFIQVTNVRSWSHPDSTRIIVQTTGPFEFRSDRVSDPDRLFVDIPHARPWIAKRRFATLPVGDKLVRRVRVAETAPGTTRIVFDLVSPSDFKITKLDAPDRMVIELRPVQTAPPTHASVALGVRRQFVYPPLSKRPQISMPGAPPIPVQTTIDTGAFPFADPMTSLMASLPVKPPGQMHASATQAIPSSTRVVSATTRVIPAAHPISSRAGATAAPTALASENASRSLTRALGLKVNRIVIDAGHGGHDFGTIGPKGVLEKDVALDVALRLSKLIQERMGAEVVLTRSDDTFIPLHERTAIANEHKADLFLSIHVNSSPAPEVAGTETFFLNFTNSPDALNVAARENAGSDKTVGELKDLIQTITLNDKIEESHTFAEDIQNAIQSQAARSNAAAHNRGVKRAPFVVLIGASMPSVLAEIGFLSNDRDETNLGKPAYRQKVAEALYKGLAQYSQSLSHFEPGRQIARTTVTKTTEKPAPSGLN
jgi:N-acetylmuramoyl-L-alanine amidase